ncbi:leucine-rich repeat domain-containing protein [Flavobacterium marginilacus]|uniref:leucine-rich repeat domain-containing protein n=1 Tax=Flavobacterium marginilacus TaxID=3003256 RepID=UPI00248D4B15|nr:immunoglobulin domain-containing protein [Flavobacterium marginilacus]
MEKKIKIKKNTIFTFCMVLFSLASFAQDYSDESTGFDATRTTASLIAHGVAKQDLNREIELMRQDYISMYILMKKEQAKILEEIESKYSLETITNKPITQNKITSKTSNPLIIETDVPQIEKDALLALYNSTNGNNWTNKTGWDFNTPVTAAWYGITVSDGHVVRIFLNNNQLSGTIPPEIGKLTELKRLTLVGNSITGTIPPEIGQLRQLQILELHNNQLTGVIPPEIGELTQLINLILSRNQLSGAIPAEIGQLTQLNSFDFGSNRLSGIIPATIGQLTNLKSINIWYNQLSGTIPAEIGQLAKLQQIILYGNQLSGTLPATIGQLTELQDVYITFNQLSGAIPATIGQLTKLVSLFLFYNKLSGSIPNEIEQLTKLQAVRLSNNQLEGKVPDFTNSVSLYNLDFADNKLRFVDFATQYDVYKSKISAFRYNSQSKTDNEKTITKGSGSTITLSMYEDNRFTPDDTYQWYKNGQVIVGATNRQFTISNLTIADAGSYYCISNNPKITDLTLIRNSIQLNVINCTPTIGMINSPEAEFCTNSESTFSFTTTTANLTYNWSAMTSDNVAINTVIGDSSGNYKYYFRKSGSYIIKADAVDVMGCTTTFTKLIEVVACNPETTCINQPINTAFETASTNINCNWYTLKEGSNQRLNPITNTTGLYTFTPTTAGTYTIYLNAYRNNECEFEFTKTVVVETCEPFVSCTKNNKNSPVVKGIFTTLLNKLISLPAETITDGYTCDELTALAFYIKDENPGIYNFIHNTQEGFISFSFTDHPELDVKIATNGNVIADFNLDNYESNTIVTELRTDSNDSFESFVNHIDFCSALYCTSHIAFVIDESGSIDQNEASKIKKQLKKYVQQQADDNDKLKSEVYVSLIGMSDSEDITKTRTDHVQQIKVTNDPAVLKKFNNWIDNYGTVNGKRRVSESSDYWKSGLDVALNSVMKPSIVIMITDGCETSDVGALRETMSHFDNSKSTTDTSIDKPHLYVLGIENGFYVDGGVNGGLLARNEDPNYIQPLAVVNSESRVVPNLRTSLKYLLSYPETQFPQANMENLRDFDYYGYENFDSLGTLENEAFLSDNLKLSGFSCGKPTDKNYCSDCLSFQPIPGNEYMLSAWVKEESFIQVKTYENAIINVIFYNDVDASELHRIATLKFIATGDIIDGWQRINSKFMIPKDTRTISVELQNNSNGIPVYYDDIRIHPLDGSIKTFVYDSETFKLMSELDENNYSTFYEYDNEGGLIRVKKETAKGVKTIQETRSGNFINTTN